MAFSFVQEAHSFAYTNGQISLTLSSSITKGNLLVAWCISTDSGASNHPTVDGGYDITWVPLLSQANTSGYGYLSVWYATVKRTRSATILVYGSDGVGSIAANLTEPSCQVMEFSGPSTNPFIVQADASGSGTSPQVNVTSSSAIGLVIGIVVPTTDAADGVETTGWTNTISSNTKSAAIYALESGSGTFTPKYSLSNSGNWGIFGVAFRIPGLTYTISGSLGSAGANAQVLFASNTTQAVVFGTANSSGNYTSPALENDTYVVIPQVVGAYFSTYSQTQVVSGANVTGLNFTSTAINTNLVFSTNYIDTMSRDDVSPIGGFWVDNGSPIPPYDYPLAIVSDEGTFSDTTIIANDAAPWKADAVSVWSTIVPNNQWAQLQIDALNSDPGTYATAFIEVRSALNNTYCYRLAIQNNGNNTAQLSLIANYIDGMTQLPPYWEYSNGQQSYGAITSNVAFALGDTIKIAVVGSVLYIYHNNILVANFYDTDITSGTFCIELTGKSTSDVQVSNFNGGAVSLATVYNPIATDTFVRAAENPLSDGGNWAEPDATNHLVLTASQEVNGATNSICAQYYNGGITWPTNQYSEVTLTSGFSGAAAAGPAVLWQTGTRNGYGILIFASGPNNFIIQKYVNGTGSNLALATITYNGGDVIRLEVLNGVLTGKQNGTTIVTANDTTYTTGFPGLVTFDDDTTVGLLGPWNGGSIVTLTNVFVNPGSVQYPGMATGTVVISQAQPTNIVIALTSSNTNIATVPASVTILAGHTSATFTVTSLNQVGSSTITANGLVSAQFSVTAPVPPVVPPPPQFGPVAGLSDFTTLYIQTLLAVNPTTQIFPLNYRISNGVYATTISRATLQAELNTRAAIQNEIWGLGWLPQNPQ